MINQETGEIEQENGFLLIPAAGGGSLVHQSQIIGARPNGTEGAIVYTKAGPSIYTILSTKNLAAILDAKVIEVRN